MKLFGGVPIVPRNKLNHSVSSMMLFFGIQKLQNIVIIKSVLPLLMNNPELPLGIMMEITEALIKL